VVSTLAMQAAAQPQASYRIQVPVVAATAVVEQRTVSQPERHCSPVRASRNDVSRESYEYYGGDGRYQSRYNRRDDEPRARGNLGAQIIGGLIGGAIGNQFGNGNGRKALPIAGAMVGSSIARDRSRELSRDRRSYRRDYEPEYVCRTTHRERVIEEVTGYDVTYRYNDALHVKRMDYDPGESMELRITAVPGPLNSSSANSLPQSNASRRTL